MPRKIDTTTLDNAARDYAAMWLQPDRKSPSGKVYITGPARVMQDLYNAHFRDEFERLRDAIREWMGKRARDEFDARAKKEFTPREDAVYEAMLAERLAITLDGDHREGVIGRVVVGQRLIGRRLVTVEAPWSIMRRKRLLLPKSERETTSKIVSYYWPIYAGEAEERLLPGGGVADDLPEGTPSPSIGAAAMGISNEAALLACDAVVDRLDEGAGAAILSIYEAARPDKVDVAVGAQVLLATLVYSDPAFGAAADQNPNARATANAITDDSSADATGTAAWFRSSASDDGAAALDDHIDGNVGTSGEDLNLNTVSIVSGATVSVTAHTVDVLEEPA